ncbi:hypothetical protein BJ875DRAFT_250164 [Amylocarpus encephaloides]|uniref:Calcium-dependent phosphotriesterase n=1 Tax=Amylocarpus encephaloides TaxID=45428 RepID=A0A9P7Y722_9HELO|nr:hypothetical protein BJ875DRAFT_250164 [Amylocarpus encephaloides]
MANLLSKFAFIGIVFFAILYQFLVKDFLFEVLGYARKTSSVHEYSRYECEKVDELGLEGCEDMWLHHKTGFLYMACSDSASRQQWLPAIGHLNASGRGLKDRIAVLDTRGPGRLAARIQWLSIENFSGINGDATLNLQGFDIRADKHTNTLRILLINHRPPISETTGELLDASKLGANSTIELFQTTVGGSSMRHVRTYSNEVIQTPNRVAWINEHSFVFTNDHSSKVGRTRVLELALGGGSVGYCDGHRCNIAYSSGLNGPNGLVRGLDGLIYVPNTVGRKIQVLSLSEDHKLQNLYEIANLLPLDNLSVDENGNIFAAAFPKLYKWSQFTTDAFNVHPPSTVLKISRAGKPYRRDRQLDSAKQHNGDFIVEKVLEDNSGILPGSTVAVHDSQTGKIFLGSVLSPFITICSPRN